MSNKLKNQILEKLNAGTSEEKFEIINGLNFTELDDELIKSIPDLLSDNDKGVRNAASMFIINSQDSRFSKYIVPFITSNDISIRNLAGEVLLKLGSNAVGAMVEFDHQNDDDTLKFIVDILGLIGDQRASLFVMGILSASENDNVVLACIEALGNLRYENSVEVLMLFYDRNELYKPTIVEALGKIGSTEALGFLTSKFSQEDELTQYSILESLGFLGNIETFFFLLEQVNNVSGPLVIPLITSLSKLKDRFSLDIPFDNKMKSLLVYTINEGTLENKKIAFDLIESFDDKDILVASLSLYGEDPDLDELIKLKLFRNIEYVYKEIGKIISNNPKNLRHLLNLFIQSITYIVKYQISLNITMVEIRSITQAVSGLLENPDEEVRKSSMEILFYLDPETALLFTDTMLADENVWNRLRLVELLENVQNEKVIGVLEKLTKDEDEMVRDRAQFIYDLKINNVSAN
ncbi:MAG: HEAT repeat domain-containing protein [Stygiobacter sp.]